MSLTADVPPIPLRTFRSPARSYRCDGESLPTVQRLSVPRIPSRVSFVAGLRTAKPLGELAVGKCSRLLARIGAEDYVPASAGTEGDYAPSGILGGSESLADCYRSRCTHQYTGTCVRIVLGFALCDAWALRATVRAGASGRNPSIHAGLRDLQAGANATVADVKTGSPKGSRIGTAWISA